MPRHPRNRSDSSIKTWPLSASNTLTNPVKVAHAININTPFYGSNGLRILERYRKCLSAADCAANKNALEGMRNTGQTGCEKLSSAAGSCTATYPMSWAAK